MARVAQVSAPQPIDDLQGWLAAFTQASVLVELLVLAASVGMAWGLVVGLRKALGSSDGKSILFGRRAVDGVLFPVVLLCLGYLARAVLNHWASAAVFKVVIPVLVALVVIRIGVKVLQVAFVEARWARSLEHTISWAAWVAMVLWVSGLLPVVLNELDQISWKVGGSNLSVRTMIEGFLTAGAVLIFTLWISSAIETRLLRSATGGELSLRKAVSNATRALLMFVG
jgi:hypothetical protein